MTESEMVVVQRFRCGCRCHFILINFNVQMASARKWTSFKLWTVISAMLRAWVVESAANV